MTSNIEGLLVVRRINYFTDSRYSALRRLPSLSLTDDEIVQRYKGIEGECWPIGDEMKSLMLSHGLAPIQQYEFVLQYFIEASMTLCCDLLYIRSSTLLDRPSFLPNNFRFCGYDYGLFYSGFDNYSVIFNEVIYGAYDSLRAYSKYLNADLLLPEPLKLEALEQDRMMLVDGGNDLETAEDDEVFQAFSIYLCG